METNNQTELNNNSTTIQQNLKKVYLIAFGGFIIFMLLMVAIKIFKMKADNQSKLEDKPKVEFHGVAETVEDKSQWIFDAQNKLKENAKQQDELKQEIEQLKAQIQQNTQTESLNNNNAVGNQQQEGKQGSSILSDNWAMSSYGNQPHVDSHIPAGTYAKAVLLSGINVSAGVNSQGMPQPVLLRLIHKGSLPNKFYGRMKDCRLTAAAHGDLSSERAFMRLEKISCVKPDGNIISVDVSGYVTGEDGVNGMRGRVVTRDAEALRSGFAAGLLSGMARGISSSFETTTINPLTGGTLTTNTAKGKDILKKGAAEGSSNAFEMMAKYSIQRAEQYQPVIQVDAGRAVHVVFQESTPFGDKLVRGFENKGDKQ